MLIAKLIQKLKTGKMELDEMSPSDLLSSIGHVFQSYSGRITISEIRLEHPNLNNGRRILSSLELSILAIIDPKLSADKIEYFDPQTTNTWDKKAQFALKKLIQEGLVKLTKLGDQEVYAPSNIVGEGIYCASIISLH